jgi:hypothetical protein
LLPHFRSRGSTRLIACPRAQVGTNARACC